MKKLPKPTKPGHSLVLRTDFSNDSAWKSICVAAEKPVSDFRAFVECISDRDFDGLSPEQIVELIPEPFDTFVFVVDSTAIADPEQSILVIDLFTERGRTFRVIPREMWCVQNNLSIANMDFDDFIRAADSDGVFRGDGAASTAPSGNLPEIRFDAPTGWEVKSQPYRLDLECGNLTATITYVEAIDFDMRLQQMKTRNKPETSTAHLSPENSLHRSIIEQKKRMQISFIASDFAQGVVVGKKYVVSEIAGIPQKRVDYLLTVPGGHVSILLDGGGADFDETDFESKLQTLSVV